MYQLFRSISRFEDVPSLISYCSFITNFDNISLFYTAPLSIVHLCYVALISVFKPLQNVGKKELIKDKITIRIIRL